MTRQTRRSFFRWELLVGGIVGLIVVTIIMESAPFDSPTEGTLSVEAPLPPRPPLVVPTDSILDTGPVSFSATLSLPVESPGRSTPVPSSPEASVERTTERREAASPAPASSASAPSTSQGSTPAPSATAAERPSAAGEAFGAPRYTGLALTYEAQRRRHRALQRKPGTDETLELGGLVVDETVTPQGRTFYSEFYGVWRSPSTSGFYTVRVQERPTPGRGTLVQVLVNDDPIFQTRLQPQTDAEPLALQAARRTYHYVRSGQGILQIF